MGSMTDRKEAGNSTVTAVSQSVELPGADWIFVDEGEELTTEQATRQFLDQPWPEQLRMMERMREDLGAAAHCRAQSHEGAVIFATRHSCQPAEPVTIEGEVVDDATLHREFRHPAYAYMVTEGQRKSWHDVDTPPEGEGWERNTDAGRNGWERFDYTEESYWRRLRRPEESSVEAPIVAQLHNVGCAGESWMIRRSDNGGRYCAACGANL